MERRLAAILSADVKGYSRLMGEDEEATIRTLTAYREVMAAVIQQHRGRVVDSPGDNLLAEFASAVDAVQCKVEEVGRELGVRYVLEGSVQKADTRVRINAQLVDATTGHHLWAESYDRELKDLFALQDEVRQKIVLALKVRLTKEEQERFRRFPTDNLEAYDFLLRGVEYWYRL